MVLNTTENNQHAPAITGARCPKEDWATIDWAKATKRVESLRQRIFRATQQQDWKKVHDLQKLLLRSYSNLVLSVRQVTQVNNGRRTPGVDGIIADTAEKRCQLVQELRQMPSQRPKPTRRIYIPKANGKQRPLGIPTIKDRIRQHVVKTALEPSWEARFEACSYGFRPGRSTHDAMEHVFLFLRKNKSSYRHEWALDADIRGAFDHISHDFIMERIGAFPARDEIKAWLKAGYLEYGRLNDTEEGTPQGGVISPLLANIALDGLREVLNQYRIPGSRSGRLGYVRYADDFIVLAPTREILEQVKATISEWLGARGLQLSEEKTRIVPIDDGFNFLGFNVRRYPNGKLLIKPQKEKVLAKLREIKQWLDRHKEIKPDQVIRHLNPILRGWTNYYQHQCSKDTFRYVEWRLFHMLWAWSLRRHSTKGKHWVKTRYFRWIGGRDWRFATKVEVRHGKQVTMALHDVLRTPIIRHPIVRTGASKDDPSLRDYWAWRNRHYGRVRYAVDTGKLRIASQQNWRCPVCRAGLFNGEPVDVYRLVRHAVGFADERVFLAMRHEACHYNAHRKDNRK